MIRPGIALGLALAELRLSRRLVRYWVFLVLAYLIGAIAVTYYAVLHYFASAFSSTVATIGPRFLVAGIGLYYVVVYMVGLVLLGFDVRARDKRERMVEVLDALPCSNLELVFGRALGVLVVSWVPVVVFAVVLAVAGAISGQAVEPWSLVSFATVLSVPAFVFTLALVMLLAVAIPNRGVVFVLSVLALAGFLVGSFRVPVWATSMLDVVGFFQPGFPSDILPTMLAEGSGWQRLGVLVAGVGLLIAAAAVHPRRDDGARATRGAIGVGVLAVGFGLTAIPAMQARAVLRDVDAWRTAHAARADEPAPDVRSVGGTVAIDPGDSIELDLAIEFAARPGEALDGALFTLNPGLTVERVESTDGGALEFGHADGLLDVALPQTLSGESVETVRVVASGRPNPMFAYLDAEVHPLGIRALDGQLFLLGLYPAVFESRYVALLPGARVFPNAGVDVDLTGKGKRATDFYRLDLEVAVPDDWLPVMVGKREATGNGRYRFAPEVPVPAPALIASRFERRAVDVNGIEVEVLMAPAHAQNLEVFAAVGPKLEEWLSEKLEEAEALGVRYPFAELSLVEVPQKLRGFGGGWRLDTTLGPSGMALMKEAGFPTARFDHHFDDPSEFEDREGDIEQAMFDYLERFFENDFTGGNPFVAISKSFLPHQLSATGAAAVPLDMVVEQLASRLVIGKYGYFSAYVLDADMQQVIGQTIGRFFERRQDVSPVDVLLETVGGQPDVWERVVSVSMREMDPTEEPEESLDALVIKTGAMAQSLIDDVGRETTGEILSELLAEHRGGAFTRDDLAEAGDRAGVDLRPWLTLWLDETELPGFQEVRSEVYRLADADDGSKRYQTVLTLANPEDVPGLVRVDVMSGGFGRNAERATVGPARVEPGSAVELGAVTSEKPRLIIVRPYLSLNRGSIDVAVGEVDDEKLREGAPFRGVRDVPWSEGTGEVLVVDDLDDGFRIETGEDGTGLRLGGSGGGDGPFDQGLPVMIGPRVRTTWMRASYPGVWGRYRRTVAIAKPGPEGDRAVFAAAFEVPTTRQLELYVAARRFGPGRSETLGTWRVEVRADGEVLETLPFDAANHEPGWNPLGTFELPAGEVEVAVAGASDDAVVVADAIRWVADGADVDPSKASEGLTAAAEGDDG